MAVSTDHGKDLPSVQLLIKKNQVGPGGAAGGGPTPQPPSGGLHILPNPRMGVS